MKITLESTPEFSEVFGVTCRVWRGATAEGVEISALIPVIRVKEADDREAFERDLKELPIGNVVPLRMLI